MCNFYNCNSPQIKNKKLFWIVWFNECQTICFIEFCYLSLQVMELEMIKPLSVLSVINNSDSRSILDFPRVYTPVLPQRYTRLLSIHLTTALEIIIPKHCMFHLRMQSCIYTVCSPTLLIDFAVMFLEYKEINDLLQPECIPVRMYVFEKINCFFCKKKLYRIESKIWVLLFLVSVRMLSFISVTQPVSKWPRFKAFWHNCSAITVKTKQKYWEERFFKERFIKFC